MLELLHPSCVHTIHELSIKRKKWKYRGEGNANLVLALPQVTLLSCKNHACLMRSTITQYLIDHEYFSHDTQRNKVIKEMHAGLNERIILRLHKCRRDAIFTPEMQKEEEERVWREALFCSSVMVPLLGTAYIQPPIPAHISSLEISQLNQNLLNQRPEFRHHKTVKCGYVNIYPDYALLPERLYHKLISASFELPIHSNNLNTSNTFDLNFTSHLFCSNFDKCLDSENRSNVTEEDSKISTLTCEDEEQQCLNNYCNSKYPTSLNFYNRMCSVIRKSKDDFSSAFLSYQNILLNLLGNTPTFCVEIKPKQGWIPPVDRRHQKCTFCLNQYLKLANCAVNIRSQYCPLELFSGDPSRMKKSIEALLKTPQNNLKIFKDGLLVYSDDSNTDIFTILHDWLGPATVNGTIDSKRLIEKFTCLVLDALTSDLLGEESYPRVEEPSSPLLSPDVTDRIPSIDLSTIVPHCDWSSNPLPANCILDRILRIQKLEQTGSDNIYRMYKMLVKTEGDYDYVRRLQDPETKNLSFDNLQRYLLATTAKDCSVLISFQSVQQLNPIRSVPCVRNITQDLDGTSYLWNIGVSDLDPKPLSCIEKHRKRDYDVITACSNLLKTTITCQI